MSPTDDLQLGVKINTPCIHRRSLLVLIGTLASVGVLALFCLHQSSTKTSISLFEVGTFYFVNVGQNSYLSGNADTVHSWGHYDGTVASLGSAPRYLQWTVIPARDTYGVAYLINVAQQKYLDAATGKLGMFLLPRGVDSLGCCPDQLQWAMKGTGEKDTFFLWNAKNGKYLNFDGKDTSEWSQGHSDDVGNSPDNLKWRLVPIDALSK